MKEAGQKTACNTSFSPSSDAVLSIQFSAILFYFIDGGEAKV